MALSKRSNIQAVLFDVDGTLVDSNESHVNAWDFAFRDECWPQELDDIRLQIGKGADHLVPALLPDASTEMSERISARHGERFDRSYLEHIRAFPSAAVLLRQVYARGVKVVLASSAKQDELKHYIRMLGVNDCISATTSVDDVDRSKPEPDIFAAALEQVAVDPMNAIIVGDTSYDIEAAKKAGVVAIGLASGPFDERQLRDTGAIMVYADVAALLADIDRWLT